MDCAACLPDGGGTSLGRTRAHNGKNLLSSDAIAEGGGRPRQRKAWSRLFSGEKTVGTAKGKQATTRGAFSHSANIYGVYPGSTPEKNCPSQSATAISSQRLLWQRKVSTSHHSDHSEG